MSLRFCHKKLPRNIYLFKVNGKNTRKRSEIYSNLTVKIPERRRRRSSVFIVNFEYSSHLFPSVSNVDFEHVNVCWIWMLIYLQDIYFNCT